MFRILFAAAILIVAVMLFMPDVTEQATDTTVVQTMRDFGEGTVPPFRKRLESGATCAELISIRDTYAPGTPEVEKMDAELRRIGCDSVTSIRND